jgi:DNA-binding NarL/FixJ family response regulator
MIRVLLADDHDLFRAGVRSLLEGLPEIQVVAEAGDGREAVELAESHRPDVALLDVMMPELNGLEAAAQFPPGVRIVILSMNSHEEFVLQALRAGAAGYVLKNTTPAELETAIRTVVKGETYLSPAVSKHVISAYLSRVGNGGTSLERLSTRQREVLQLIAEGRGTKEIARKLGVSTKTVEMHRVHLMQALDIHDVPGLVKYAIKMGVISID